MQNIHAPKRILVVEDDTSLQPILRALIRSIDPEIAVDWATDADGVIGESSALGRAARLNYDLIVADLFLPGRKSGIDLWDLCQSERTTTKFLLTSGLSQDNIRRSFAGSPGDLGPCFLPKDVPLDNRREIIRLLLAE